MYPTGVRRKNNATRSDSRLDWCDNTYWNCRLAHSVRNCDYCNYYKKYKDANELQANLQKFWQSIPREERDKYYKDVEEVDKYELEDNGYVIIDGNCIYKIELDKEFDMDNNFVEVAKTQDDTYEFITWFYNGSTDLQEMLQKGLDQTRNSAEEV